MSVYFIVLFLVMFFSALAERERLQCVLMSGRIRERTEKSFWTYVVLCATILILVSGLRFDVGTDYIGYVFSYHIRAARFREDLLSFSEPGLGFLAWLGHFLSQDYVTIFLLSALVTVSLNLLTICKYSEDVFLGICLYLLIGAWHNSFNGIRQYLAAAVLFAGHRYMFERKLLKYIAVVLLAACFHRTVLIMLPVYFIVGRKFTFKNTLYLLVCFLAIRLSTNHFFNIMSVLKGHDQSGYAYMQQEVNPLRLLATLPPILLAFFTPRSYRELPENAFYLMLMILNACFMFATEGSAYLARVGIYTEIFLTIGIPRFIRAFDSQSRTFLTVAMLIYWGIFWAYEISVRDSLNHFHWIFDRTL